MTVRELLAFCNVNNLMVAVILNILLLLIVLVLSVCFIGLFWCVCDFVVNEILECFYKEGKGDGDK